MGKQEVQRRVQARGIVTWAGLFLGLASALAMGSPAWAAVAASARVSVDPVMAILNPGRSYNLTATVTGAENAKVFWMVDGIANGNAAVGTVVPAGGQEVTYTAPAATGQHVVIATSAADGSQSALCQVCILPSSLRVTVEPGSVTVSGGQPDTLTAKVSEPGSQVTWEVDGVVNGNDTVGTIVSAQGLSAVYTAPADSGQHLIRAISTEDTSQSATTRIRIQGAERVAVPVPAAPALAPAASANAAPVAPASQSTTPEPAAPLAAQSVAPQAQSATPAAKATDAKVKEAAEALP